MYILGNIVYNNKRSVCQKKMFGPHMTLDLYGCDKKKLGDKKFIVQLLDELPSVIGMHKFAGPFVEYYENKETFDSGGFSGFVLIAESHISIHTFIEQKFATVDIFSCKSFNQKKAIDFLTEKLNAKKIERNFIIRGKDFVKHYPKIVSKAKQIVENERIKFIKR